MPAPSWPCTGVQQCTPNSASRVCGPSPAHEPPSPAPCTVARLTGSGTAQAALNKLGTSFLGHVRGARGALQVKAGLMYCECWAGCNELQAVVPAHLALWGQLRLLRLQPPLDVAALAGEASGQRKKALCKSRPFFVLDTRAWLHVLRPQGCTMQTCPIQFYATSGTYSCLPAVGARDPQVEPTWPLGQNACVCHIGR